MSCRGTSYTEYMCRVRNQQSFFPSVDANLLYESDVHAIDITRSRFTRT